MPSLFEGVNPWGKLGGTMQELLDRDKPSVVSIWLGVNDVWHGPKGTTPEDFEAGLGSWSATGDWGIDTQSTKCAQQAAPFPSAVNAARCGSPKVPGQPCDYQEGGSFLSLITPVLIPATATAAVLELESYSDVECEICGYDDRFVNVYANGLLVAFGQLTGPLEVWTTVQLDLTAYIGQSISVVFYFETYDDEQNDGVGWLIDDVRIAVDGACSYCIAGTSGGGCQALLSGVGTPSVSSSSGFVVSAATVEGNRPGIFFWGVNGSLAQPWGNGSSSRKA